MNENTFCILDLIQILSDKETVKFCPNDNESYSFTNFKWNKNSLTLIDDESGYTFIKDGVLKLKQLSLMADWATLQSLSNYNLVVEEGHENNSTYLREDKIYTLDLSNIPMINKSIADDDITAERLLDDTLKEHMLESQLEIYNALKSELTSHIFIKNVKKEDDNANIVFKVDIEELGRTPSLESVKKAVGNIMSFGEGRVKKQPELSLVMSLTVPIIMEFGYLTHSLSIDDKINFIDKKISAIKDLLNRVTMNIQRIKFGIILGNKWFNDISQSDNEQLVKFNPSIALLNTEEKLTGIIHVYKKGD